MQNGTSIPVSKQPLANNNKKTTQVGLVAVIMILLAAVLFTVVIAVVVFVFCYRKRLKEKFPGDSKAQRQIVRLQEIDDIIAVSSTLVPSEPTTPSQIDGTLRTFTYPLPRRRLSSSGSINSTTPLLKYRNGSYRSRFSSGVSSRIDSNIAEGKELSHVVPMP